MYEAKYICDQNLVIFRSLISETWCSRNSRDTQTDTPEKIHRHQRFSVARGRGVKIAGSKQIIQQLHHLSVMPWLHVK